MDYLVNDYIGLRSEMKFRDPQFNLKNRYKNDTKVTQKEFDSKINVDGVTFILGAFLNF
jgi:hypothetical protein